MAVGLESAAVLTISFPAADEQPETSRDPVQVHLS